MIKQIAIAIVACTCAGVFAYEIKLPEKPLNTEKSAAKELKHYLSLAAKSVKINGKDAVFHIGNSKFAAGKGLNSSKFKSEEWMIRSYGNQVVLLGGGPRGTLYSVFRFLEDQIGIRWWNQHEEYIPPKKAITFKRLDHRGKPYFEMREIVVGLRWKKLSEKYNYIRNMQNSDSVWKHFRYPGAYGGEYTYGSPYMVHSSQLYVPHTKYFKTNPEYFALVKGKRNPKALCLTNPALHDFIYKRMLAYIKEDRARCKKENKPYPALYDFSMNDHWVQCGCATCKEAYKKDNASGVYVDFLNRLSDKVRKVYPDVRLETIAYYYLETPPKNTKPSKDIIIRLCSTQRDLLMGLDHPRNRHYKNLVKRWAAITKNLYVWDYTVTYMTAKGLPLPSEFIIDKLVRQYRDNNVKGIFFEHEASDTADMHTLKVWMELKLMNDPTLNGNDLFMDFMTKYYGPAAKPLIRYRRELRALAEKNQIQSTVYDCGAGNFMWIDLKSLLRFHKLCDEAEKLAAKDPVYLRRVRVARQSLDRLTAVARPQFYYREWKLGPNGTKPFPLNMKAIRKRYVEVSKAYYKFNGNDISGKKELKSRTDKRIAQVYKNFDELLTKDESYYGSKYRPDPKFKGKKIFEYLAGDCKLVGKSLKRVTDPTSSAHQVVRFDLSHFKGKPIPICFYSAVKGSDNFYTGMNFSNWKDYRWVKIGTGRITTQGYFYYTPGWNLQIHTGPFPADQKITAWTQIKLETEGKTPVLKVARLVLEFHDKK